MEKHLERLMDDLIATKNVSGCVFADHLGLCLGAKGEASTESSGVLVALTEQVAKLEPQSGLPVIALENDTRSCTILRSGTITGAIFKNIVMLNYLMRSFSNEMDIQTEIRKLSPGNLFALVQILDYDESWKRLMAIIPKTLTLDNFECKIAINNLPKYNTDHFKLIENAGSQLKKPCSEILFQEWGTSGRIRPRLGHLLRLLEKAQLYRAADFVAVNLLNISPPERPQSGPAAKVDTSLNFTTTSNNNTDIERLLDQIHYPSSIINDNSSYQINNNVNQNIEPPKLIIPKIVVNDDSSSNQIQQNMSSPSTRSNNVSSSYSASLVQLERKIERLSYSPQLPETLTESTTIDSNIISSTSDMIQFSSSDNQIPALSDLLIESISSNQSSPIVSEARNYTLPQISELIRSGRISVTEINTLPQLSELIHSGQISVEDLNNLPDFSNIINHSSSVHNSSNLPAFSQILQSESDIVPAFSQILSSNDNSDILPAFSAIISHPEQYKNLEINEENQDVPHISILLDDNAQNQFVSVPNFNLLQSDKIHTSELMVTRKTSLSPVNTSSRTTCASPLPNLSLNTVLPHFTYLELEQCTRNFDEDMLSSHHSVYENEPKGRKLGSGAFGSVYLGLGLLDKPVAVKKLNLNGVNVVNVDDTITKQFRNEVELLCKYKHENLLSLLGYSCDGPTYCLIYEYICGGALKDRLQSVENRLIWTNRLYIALGTAKAVSYLHNAYSMPLIHRDIKTANILLDNADKPKLCDFGLIKLTPNQNTNTSTTVFGTSAYMAPEAFRGDVSVKLDTFSFGVVLLELLTGLPPLDENREGNDLVTHVEDVCEDDIKPLLDTRAGSWMLKNTHFGEQLYLIATQCLEEKKKRPVMKEVVKQLSQLIDKTM